MKDQLDYTLWVTSGIRFSQSLRYEKLESTINFALLMLSVYLTIFSLLIPHLFSDDAQLVSLFITSSSILITGLVVLLKSANFNRRSILQHECGRKIRKLLYDLKVAVNDEEIIAINNQYNRILDDFENHKKIDLSYFWYESHSKVDDSKKNNVPNEFHREFMAPLVYSVFPFVTKTLSILVPPFLMYLISTN